MTRPTTLPNPAAHPPWPKCLRKAVVRVSTLALLAILPAQVQAQSLAFTGLRTSAYQGQFNAIRSDASGNLYLLLDQQDGIRLLKTDPTANTLLAQIHIGAQGDTSLGLALDPSGNVYITGTTTSNSLASTAGVAFPNAIAGSTNSFIAKFDSNLNQIFLTFAGSGKISASSIAATASGVFLTGSIFAATLPVTPSAIQQAPSFGSLQNGFVEKFNPTGATLLYATYLTGFGGDTAPAALTADASGNAYIAGYTSASGYPTFNAMVPNIIPNTAGAISGFLTKLSPTADALLFSTFIPGGGLTSIALDPATQNLLLTGNISLGQFSVANVQTPLTPTAYQSLLRLPLDGSSVLGSTLLAPGTQSFVTPALSGAAWVAGDLSAPLLPVPALSTLGNSFAAHVTTQNTIDQTARFGGLPTSRPTFASAFSSLTSLTIDASGQPTFAGAILPQASASLLLTETFDLPLFNAPTAALPSTLRDTLITPTACTQSLCNGSAAYLAKLASASTPSLALSYDAAPNLTLRNLGTAQANSLTLTSTLTFNTNCSATLSPGAECSIALTSAGPGTITLQATNATTQTIAIPAFTAAQSLVVYSPKELDFGIQTATSAPATRTITISNLTSQSQAFTSKQDTSSRTLPYTLAESSSDCTLTGPTTKLLAAGATCHITLALTASSTAANDTFLNAQWLIGPASSQQDIFVTAYLQAAQLSLSAPQIDFGTQYTGGLHQPRFLYLSNSSDALASHAVIPTSATSPFKVQDRCPTALNPRSVCQLQLDYLPTATPSNDSTTLRLDQGLSVLVTGQSIAAPGVGGATINPNLTVTPASLNFPNAVVVTTLSTTTQNVTIGNTGASAFTLTLGLSGDFTSTTNCPPSLAAGSTCTLVLTFAPSQPGLRQGILSVTAGANATPVYVNLTGTGTAIFPANNGTLDLGSVIVNQPAVQWFKIAQPFSSLTVNSTSPEFSAILVEDIGYGHGQPPSAFFASTYTGTCTNCWLGLQFKPAATGARNATLSLLSNPAGNPYTVALIGTGLPQSGLVLTPLTQDFGSVPIHSTSAPSLFTLTNITAAAITVTAPTAAGDFLIGTAPTGGAACTGTLAPNASCFVQIAFAPMTSGPRTGALTLTTSAGTATSTLTGFATPDPGLALNPTALIFHNLPGPTSTAQTITLTNTGSTQLQIAPPTATLSNFLPSANCTTLAPAATCTVTVTFLPSAATVTANLQIPVTVTIAGNPSTTTYTVPLTGAYTTADTGLQIVPAQANFGPNPTSALGLTRQFTINNLTAKSLSLAITIPHQFVLASPPCSGLAPNASCSFSVAFLPLTNAGITGTLFAQANPGDGSATLNAITYLEGYGTAANTLVIAGPISPGGIVNFGQVASGQTLVKTLTLTNAGGATSPASTAITIRRITTQWPFRATSTCGQTLTVNQTCTVTVTYNALNQVVTGTISPLPTNDAGILTIESDSIASPDLVNLAGTAAPAAVASPSNTAPLLSYIASQSSLTFPTTSIGNLSAPQTVTLANTGTATLNILTLKPSADFTASTTCTALVPGASCAVAIYFAPQLQNQPQNQSQTTRIGALEVLSDASSALEFISLIGTTSPSSLTLTPAALDFGTVQLGANGLLPLQIANTGSTAVTFNGITATGDYTAGLGTCPAAGSTLPIASNCTAQITFTPTLTGTRTGTVSVATSASNIPLVVALTGIGTQSRLQIAPATLNFGSIAVGSPALLTLTLTNTGNAAITNLALTTTTGDFAVTVPCNVATLIPGAACPVSVTFTPSATGPSNATLTIASSASSSPDLVPLTGTGIANGTFTLTVNGSNTATATVASGRPATYNLTVTPINSFSGAIVLNCTPITPAPNATCGLLPSIVVLNGTPQNAVATIQTVTSAAIPAYLTRNNTPTNPHRTISSKLGTAVLCLLTPALFLFWRNPRHTRPTPSTFWTTLLTAAALATLLTASGCGGSGDPNIRYSTPGTYQYQVTASSISGLQITQTVTLNLTITAHN